MAFMSNAESIVQEVPTANELTAAGVSESEIISMDLSIWLHRVKSCDDELYRSKRDLGRTKAKSLNASWPLRTVWSYMTNRLVERVQAQTFNSLVTLPSISWFIASMREACDNTRAWFWWPNPSINFQQTLTTAAHEAPPGHMVVVKNRRPHPRASIQ